MVVGIYQIRHLAGPGPGNYSFFLEQPLLDLIWCQSPHNPHRTRGV